MRIECKYDELVDIEKLVPYPNNPNIHPKDQIERLAYNLKIIGWRKPVVISKLSGCIITGHGTVEAAKHNGWTKVPVNYQEFKDKAEEYAYVVSDNSMQSYSKLDVEIIKETMLELPDIDIELMAMDELIVPEAKKFDEEKEDDVPDVQKDAISKPGDLWLLGEHRLLCGDSTNIQHIERLLNNLKPDMVFTDPPYNMAFNGRSGKFDVIKNDNMDKEKFKEFILEWIQCLKTINPNTYYVCCNWKFYGILQESLNPKACIVWAKNVFGLGKGYRHQHEFILFDGFIQQDIKNESDLWEIKKDTQYKHPTQKPVALSERAINNSSKENNIILDFFMGSGSTLIACEKTNRICYGLELDEHYCDVIIRRWQNLTGQKATLEGTKEAYDDMLQKRNKL